MNTLKRFNINIAIFITVLIFLTSSLSAQQRQGQGPPQIPNATQISKMVNDLSSQLSLTESQSTKISLLFTDHFADVRSSMESQKKSRDEMENLKKEFEDDVKSLLSDEQQNLFVEFMEKNHKQKGQKTRR